MAGSAARGTRASCCSAVPAAVNRIHRRLLPLFVALTCVVYVDRTSLGFAALQLCHQPWFDQRVMGTGAALFTCSYVLLQVPSNLVLLRLGGHVWLPAITAAWGVVSMCFAAMRSPAAFYALRIALGAAEAGSFPGMWTTAEKFYPRAYITVPYSVIEAAIALAQIIAAPLAAGLLATEFRGLKGWQNLFLVQGAVTLVFAGVLRALLPASVEAASFLTPQDKAWIAEQQAADLAALCTDGAAVGAGTGPPYTVGADSSNSRGVSSHTAQPVPLPAGRQLLAAASNRKLWQLVAIKVLKDLALDSLVYFTPALIHALLSGGAAALGVHPEGGEGKQCGGKGAQLRATLLTLVPFGCAATATLAIGHSSEVTGERRLHIGVPLLVGGLIFALMPLFLHREMLVLAFACVVAAVIAADATTGPFWSLVLSASSPGCSAVALAAVNSLGKLGGAVGTYLFGLMSFHTGSVLGPVLLLSLALVGAGVLALLYQGDAAERRGYIHLERQEEPATELADMR